MYLTPAAKLRLRWMEHYDKYRNARLTCRHFGISPDTFYHWKRKYVKANPQTLEDTATRRPRKLRQARWSQQLLDAIAMIKRGHPSYGRGRLRSALQEKGYAVSASTVGRILRTKGFSF